MDTILKYLFANLNGATETVLLFILVFFDTILGSKWRKANNVAITSNGGLGGLKISIPLALAPMVIWLITILFSVLPTHIGNRVFVFDTPIFDWITFATFIGIANFMSKSLLANAQLAGFTVPNWAIKWVEDEYHVKLKKIETEPEAANITEIGKEK
ncbi:hypothetical protein [Leuconostoc mesenteroides]|uniref:hypothetical protein n=1 Tax=Leuconostoc mesenteroides TaxID=1245 RepID=UPI0022E97171|nr:hypothetical protein [Leuconostoc mesenteroides]